MEELVERLSRGDHPVEFSLRPEKTIGVLKDCLDRKYVHIKFTGTRGGTELGFALDPAVTDLSGADFSSATGRVKVGGELTLNYVKVRCLADIDLSTMTGIGHLQPLES